MAADNIPKRTAPSPPENAIGATRATRQDLNLHLPTNGAHDRCVHSRPRQLGPYPLERRAWLPVPDYTDAMSSPPAIRPMVLRRFREPFSDPDWLFEVKHDGFRALAYTVGGDCRLVSRKNHVYRAFGPVCDSVGEALGDRDAVLDGELVCLGPDGRSLFKHLMYRRGDPHFYAFDLLWLDGEDLREWPLIERKKALRKIVPARGSRLLYVDHIVGRGEDMFKLVCAQDLEGVVAKWKLGAYMPDDRTSWVKIKNPSYTQSVGREKMFEKRGA